DRMILRVGNVEIASRVRRYASQPSKSRLPKRRHICGVYAGRSSAQHCSHLIFEIDFAYAVIESVGNIDPAQSPIIYLHSRRRVEPRLQSLSVVSAECPFLTCEETRGLCKSVFPQDDIARRVAYVDPIARVLRHIAGHFRSVALAHTRHYDKCGDAVACRAR